MAEQIDFIQICYSAEHYKTCFPFSVHYHNYGLTPFFENTIISDLVKESKADKIAVCSWSLARKMTMRLPPRRELTEEVLHEDFDVMSFTKNSPDHDMVGALEGWHKGSREILGKIFSKLGKPFPKKPKFPIYQNAFCARAGVYKRYVTEFLDPAMELMATDEEIRNLCFQDSGYNETIDRRPVDFSRTKKYLGLPYYPMHPFILERCFSIWLDDKNLNVVYL